MKDNLSIIFPIYNEEKNIINVIENAISYIRRHLNDFEIIAVNDGSSDASLEKLKQAQALYPALKIISHSQNEGYGSAVKTGIQHAQKEWIFIMDADGQFLIDDFGAFWEWHRAYDFILGYRASRSDNLYRRWLGQVGNWISNLFFSEKIKDINCGLKLFKSKQLRNIPLISTGACVYFEILLYLLKSNNNNFIQLPVTHYKRNGGRETGGSLKVIAKIIYEGAKIVLYK